VTRKGKLRQLADGEDAHLEHLLAGAQPLSLDEAAAVSDHDDARRRRPPSVVDVEKRVDLDTRADLLATFTRDRVGGALIVIHESARQAPQTIPGLDAAPSQHDAARRGDDHRSGNLRVAPEDEVVMGTGFELAALQHLDHQRRAAVDAEVPHRSRA
jgi:hypothetical protein